MGSQAEASAEQVRGWSLDGALLLEVTEADRPPLFLVRVAGSWTWCADLEAATAVVWQERRTRASLPAQWTPPSAEVMDEFHRHWEQLRTLQAGQWWPQQPAAHAEAAGAGDSTLD